MNLELCFYFCCGVYLFRVGLHKVFLCAFCAELPIPEFGKQIRNIFVLCLVYLIRRELVDKGRRRLLQLLMFFQLLLVLFLCGPVTLRWWANMWGQRLQYPFSCAVHG